MWYKFEAIHGPGHQSHTEEYKWLEPELTGELMGEVWSDWVNGEDMDWPKGSLTAIEKLPEKERLAQIRKYQDRIEDAEYMLKILLGEERHNETTL